MSGRTIPEVVRHMLEPLRAELGNPDEHERQLDSLITQTNDQTHVPASVRHELTATLERQRKHLRAARLAAIGAELRQHLRSEFGLLIEVRVAQRKRRKAKSAVPSTERPSAPKTPLAGEVEAQAPAAEARHGWLDARRQS